MDVRDLLCGWFGLTRSPWVSAGIIHLFRDHWAQRGFFPILLSISYVYPLLANKEAARV